MALEVNIWPWDDLGGRPQMTSILLRSLYGLGCQYMALEAIIWPWRSASDDH